MFALPLLALLGGAAPVAGVFGGGMVQTQTFTFHERIIIRVPRVSDDRAAARGYSRSRSVTWHEEDSDDCVDPGRFVGAGISSERSIDFLTRDGQRLRAKLEDACPALDYYSMVYVRPGKDGKICANRDSVRSRAGGQCQIAAFKRLVASR
ncbi:hypothetical protein [Stakelama marina]|uniref:Uncharacterized protein n=1 Tax=Stakelama marina TaxID=2826939 RepID=A0A8T4IEA3_9SPHN|nr:hypothetical protein [Stakelama marina]MBR0552392.1 hypothetical protein [Stakelama marina]